MLAPVTPFGALARPRPRPSFLRELALVVAGAGTATLVHQVGKGVREWLRETRAERRGECPECGARTEKADGEPTEPTT